MPVFQVEQEDFHKVL